MLCGWGSEPVIARMLGKIRREVLALRLDARLLQITTLLLLFIIQAMAFDFGASILQATMTIGAALATQSAFAKLQGTRGDWRSAMISGLSLSLLLRAHSPLLWICAGVLAIASKSLIRIRGKHVFNPSCFAIVVLLLTSGQVWVSPGVWGTDVWFSFLAASLAALVLSQAARVDIALGFLAAYGGMLLARCLLLGDPLAIPLHQMRSGALLLFSMFMITDPRSTPDDRVGRLVFAALVAAVAYELQFGWQIREGLFYALILASPCIPLIDLWRPARRFRWINPQEA
jgi:Na+-translocating ferredoxin:NAD+ oxidoreductase RnfD subunit